MLTAVSIVSVSNGIPPVLPHLCYPLLSQDREIAPRAFQRYPQHLADRCGFQPLLASLLAMQDLLRTEDPVVIPGLEVCRQGQPTWH